MNEELEATPVDVQKTDAPMIDATIGILHSPHFPNCDGSFSEFMDRVELIHSTLMEMRKRELER